MVKCGNTKVHRSPLCEWKWYDTAKGRHPFHRGWPFLRLLLVQSWPAIVWSSAHQVWTIGHCTPFTFMSALGRQHHRSQEAPGCGQHLATQHRGSRTHMRSPISEEKQPMKAWKIGCVGAYSSRKTTQVHRKCFFIFSKRSSIRASLSCSIFFNEYINVVQIYKNNACLVSF